MTGREDHLELRKGSEAELAELAGVRASEFPGPAKPSAWGWLGTRDGLPDIFTLGPPTDNSPMGTLLIAPRKQKAIGVIGAFLVDPRVGSLFCQLWVTPSWRRKRVGSWALERFLTYCFGEYRFVKANMLVSGDDLAMRSFASSAGFCLEADIALPAGSSRTSELVFGLTAADFGLRRVGGVVVQASDAATFKTAGTHRRRDWPDIRLRSQRAGDVEWILSELQQDEPRATGDALRWPESESELAAAWTADERVGPPPLGSLMVEFGDAPVGSIAVIRAEPQTSTFWYGLWIAPSVRRRGFAGAAVRELLRRMFLELGYKKAFAGVFSYNHASIGLHTSLGFVLEGRVRAAVFTGGRHWDELIFGLDVERWRLDE